MEDKYLAHIPIHGTTTQNKENTKVQNEQYQSSQYDSETEQNSTEENAYKCRYGKLWQHFQKHKIVSRFKCDQCTFSSGSSACLNQHIPLHKNKGESKKTRNGNRDSLTSLTSLGSTTDASSTVLGRYKNRERRKTNVLANVTELKQEEIYEKCANMAMDIPLTSMELLNMKNEKKGILCKSCNILDDRSTPMSDCTNSSNDDFYRCKECPFETSYKIFLTLHLEMHYNARRPFKCNMCTYNCFTAESLHSHLNLHIPPSSPNSASSNRKRAAAKRRNGYLFDPDETVSTNGTNLLKCNQCFKSVPRDDFLQHKMEHAKSFQQRLMTSIKRTLNEDQSSELLKTKRIPRKTDKDPYCSYCCFKCDTPQAFSRHMEFHNQKATFKCSLCNYSADTHNIILFHEQNHHINRSLTSLASSMDLPTNNINDSNRHPIDCYGEDSLHQDIIIPSKDTLKCMRCNFSCSDLTSIEIHWETKHLNTSNPTDKDREVLQMLKMKLIPKNEICVL